MMLVSGKSGRGAAVILVGDHRRASAEYFRIRKYDHNIENANETVDGGAKACADAWQTAKTHHDSKLREDGHDPGP
ncbi:hypothetical protein [Novosphingobium terrae]|uniref:hypothetical protein n=1 Tax=Novosphingobium terrae TaxID=2726189 RepID=UPI0019820284|nr:hypothetical protein [Novosphingobium terrae]